MATTFRASAAGKTAIAAIGSVLASALTAAPISRPQPVKLPEPTSAPK